MGGNVTWMSESARLALGPAFRTVSTISWAGPQENPVTTGKGSKFYFTRLWSAGGRMVVGVRQAEAISGEADLLRVQVSLLRHYIRLQAIERKLANRALQRRQTTSRVRQLELERQRLGTELHTSVGQLLSAIRLQLEVIAPHLVSPAPPVQEALDRISALSAEALEQVRSVSRRLHPPEWQRFTLQDAIRQLWDASGIAQRFESRLELETFAEPELDAKVLLYRAAQEALSNVMRHARASRVEAALTRRGNTIRLRFEDNGVGFDPARLLAGPASLSAGIGLRTIREQAEELGGKLYIESGPGRTRVEISVPFRPSQPQDVG